MRSPRYCSSFAAVFRAVGDSSRCGDFLIWQMPSAEAIPEMRDGCPWKGFEGIGVCRPCDGGGAAFHYLRYMLFQVYFSLIVFNYAGGVDKKPKWLTLKREATDHFRKFV